MHQVWRQKFGCSSLHSPPNLLDCILRSLSSPSFAARNLVGLIADVTSGFSFNIAAMPPAFTKKKVVADWYKHALGLVAPCNDCGYDEWLIHGLRLFFALVKMARCMVPLYKSTSEEELSSLMTHRSIQLHSMIYTFLATAVDLML